MDIQRSILLGAVLFAANAAADEPPKEVTNSIGMKLVLIPAGEFEMGARASLPQLMQVFPHANSDWLEGERPRHHVRITKSFYMSAYETRLKDFLKFYHAAKYKIEAERDGKPSWGLDARGVTLVKSNTFRPWQPGWTQTQEHPVVYVSWNDAVAFCEWLSRKEEKKYRLPTEAEWEYACRGGTTTRFWCGDDPDDLTSIGNVADVDLKTLWPDATVPEFDRQGNRTGATRPFPYLNSRDGFVFTAPVGQFRPNPFGLYDMHGNVWEWCHDGYDRDYYNESPVANPPGPPSGATRVMRGGAWNNGPANVRSANRMKDQPAHRYMNIGFRVVCESDGGFAPAGAE